MPRGTPAFRSESLSRAIARASGLSWDTAWTRGFSCSIRLIYVYDSVRYNRIRLQESQIHRHQLDSRKLSVFEPSENLGNGSVFKLDRHCEGGGPLPERSHPVVGQICDLGERRGQQSHNDSEGECNLESALRSHVGTQRFEIAGSVWVCVWTVWKGNPQQLRDLKRNQRRAASTHSLGRKLITEIIGSTLQ